MSCLPCQVRAFMLQLSMSVILGCRSRRRQSTTAPKYNCSVSKRLGRLASAITASWVGSNLQFVRIGRLLVRVDNGLDQRWPRRAQRRLDRGPHLLGTLAPKPFRAAGAGEGD